MEKKLFDIEPIILPPIKVDLSTKLEFGNTQHLRIVEFGEQYAKGKEKLPMSFTENDFQYECSFSCSNCGLVKRITLPVSLFRKKNILVSTKKMRIARNIKQNIHLLKCTCGTQHRIDMRNFSVKLKRQKLQIMQPVGLIPLFQY